MRPALFALAFMLPFGALAQTAAASGEERSDLLLQLIRDNGCKMTTAEADDMLPKHDLTKSETRDIIRSWGEQGMVEMKGMVIQLSDKGCKG